MLKPTAVVTGAGSGIGKATAELLARDGYRVACFDIDLGAARNVAQSIGREAVAARVDVADEGAVQTAFSKVAKQFKRINALATCAGILDTAGFMELDSRSFRRVYDINVLGTFLSMREAARYMPKGARICTVSSIAGLRGSGGMGGTGGVGTVAYASSKGAVLALTKSAARMLVGRGISVNTVSPGTADTPINSRITAAARRKLRQLNLLKRFAKAEEIAQAIVFLLSPAASYITGSNLVVDGGIVMY